MHQYHTGFYRFRESAPSWQSVCVYVLRERTLPCRCSDSIVSLTRLFSSATLYVDTTRTLKGMSILLSYMVKASEAQYGNNIDKIAFADEVEDFLKR